MNLHPFAAFPILLALLPAALGQGSDDCAAPTPISGFGSFLYDSNAATTSGFTGSTGGCGGGENDVFFAWTASASGDHRFELCGTPWDTKLAVYSGDDCSAVCIASNDDLCNLQSRIDVSGVTIGDKILVQIGSFTAGEVGISSLVVSQTPTPPSNDTCATPAVALEGTTSWNNGAATTSGFDGGDPATCMSPANTDLSALGQCHQDLFWVFTAPGTAVFQIDTNGSTGINDTRMNIHGGDDCSAVCLQSDDDGGSLGLSLTVISASFGQEFLIQVGSWAATSATGDGLLNITDLSAASGLSISCEPVVPHYLGGSATLQASTLGSGSPTGLHLECTDGPAGEFGFFMVASGAGAAVPIFNGVLCLTAPQGRYNGQVATNQGLPQLNSVGQFDSSGVLQSLFGNAASTGGSGFDVPLELPFTPPGQVISPGDTWSFQCWFRDQVGAPPVPGSSANFSNVITASFP